MLQIDRQTVYPIWISSAKADARTIPDNRVSWHRYQPDTCQVYLQMDC